VSVGAVAVAMPEVKVREVVMVQVEEPKLAVEVLKLVEVDCISLMLVSMSNF
jgi:hypothetical protein